MLLSASRTGILRSANYPRLLLLLYVGFDRVTGVVGVSRRPSILCPGGALPVIMSINGPRETHDYLRNL